METILGITQRETMEESTDSSLDPVQLRAKMEAVVQRARPVRERIDRMQRFVDFVRDPLVQKIMLRQGGSDAILTTLLEARKRKKNISFAEAIHTLGQDCSREPILCADFLWGDLKDEEFDSFTAQLRDANGSTEAMMQRIDQELLHPLQQELLGIIGRIRAAIADHRTHTLTIMVGHHAGKNGEHSEALHSLEEASQKELLHIFNLSADPPPVQRIHHRNGEHKKSGHNGRH